MIDDYNTVIPPSPTVGYTIYGEAIKPGLDSGLDELPCVNNLFAARIAEFACPSVASNIVLGIVCQQRFTVSTTVEVA